MKKTLIVVLLALSVSCAFAQERETEELDWRNELQRHEVGLGIGDCALAKVYRPNFFSQNHTLQDAWFTDMSYNHGPVYSTCPISFHYLYRVAKFLWLGGEFTYCGMFSENFSTVDMSSLGHYQENYLTIMPTIRFSYLNKKYVTLYSGISTGVLVGIYGENNTHPAYAKAHFAGQLTAFGVSAGNKWFGFTEIGVGYNGFIRAGFGYRFNRNEIHE